MVAEGVMDLVEENREDIKLALHYFYLGHPKYIHNSEGLLVWALVANSGPSLTPLNKKEGGQYEYLCGQLISGCD